MLEQLIYGLVRDFNERNASNFTTTWESKQCANILQLAVDLQCSYTAVDLQCIYTANSGFTV